MIGRIRRLPSPALVISVIALIVAVGSGTYALAINSHGAKKIANKQIKRKAPGLHVKHAKSADNATHATNADNASHATNADNATTANGAPPIGPAGGGLTGNYPNPLIGNNAVTNINILDNAVSSPKIADNAVSSPKIADDAVSSPKIADESVHASEFGSTTQVVSASVGIAANPGAATAVAACPDGTQVLSGGGFADSNDVVTVGSFENGNKWEWVARNLGADPHNISATAVCLNG